MKILLLIPFVKIGCKFTLFYNKASENEEKNANL